MQIRKLWKTWLYINVLYLCCGVQDGGGLESSRCSLGLILLKLHATGQFSNFKKEIPDFKWVWRYLLFLSGLDQRLAGCVRGWLAGWVLRTKACISEWPMQEEMWSVNPSLAVLLHPALYESSTENTRRALKGRYFPCVCNQNYVVLVKLKWVVYITHSTKWLGLRGPLNTIII